MMRLLSTALLLVALAVALASAMTLPVVSYNIRSGSNFSGFYNISHTGAQILAMAPMLVGVQEVDNMTERHPGDDQPAILGKITGMYPTFCKFRDFEGGGYGTLVLSAWEPLKTAQVHFTGVNGQPTTPSQCAVESYNDGCQGGCAVLVPLTDTQTLWFATTHIASDCASSFRANETTQLAAWLHTLASSTSPPTPVLVTGDFNVSPSDPAIAAMLSAGFQDQWAACGNVTASGDTFNSSDPTERIDYQLLLPTGGAGDPVCTAAQVWNVQTSDHRPLKVEYTVGTSE